MLTHVCDAPGSIGCHVMIPGSLTVRVIGTPVGLTFAAAVIVTLPVPMVNWFPVTLVLAAADTVIVPIPKVNGVGVGVTFAAAAIVSDPKLSVNGLPDGDTNAPANAEELPILNVKGLPVTFISTLGLKNDVDIGAPDKEVSPSMVYAPDFGYLVLVAVRLACSSVSVSPPSNSA